MSAGQRREPLMAATTTAADGSAVAAVSREPDQLDNARRSGCRLNWPGDNPPWTPGTVSLRGLPAEVSDRRRIHHRQRDHHLRDMGGEAAAISPAPGPRGATHLAIPLLLRFALLHPVRDLHGLVLVANR